MLLLQRPAQTKGDCCIAAGRRIRLSVPGGLLIARVFVAQLPVSRTGINIATRLGYDR